MSPCAAASERVDILVGTRKLRCMIDLRRLRALRELADRGTIAATADALHLTPSAVSQQLAALEREVGQPLLEPNGRTRAPHAGRRARSSAHADALFSRGRAAWTPRSRRWPAAPSATFASARSRPRSAA